MSRKPWLIAKAGLGLALLGSVPAAAQAVQTTAKAEYDSFFGFYPSLSVTHALDSARQLAGYATYYTQPGSAGVELGTGLTLAFPRRSLTLIPSAGVLSGSFFGPGRGFLVGEGFTASLAAQREGPRLSAAVALGYYGLLRQKTPDVYDIAFYHLEVGYKLTPRLTLGGLHEQILAVRLPHNNGDDTAFQLARVGIFGRGQLPGGVQAELAGNWLGTGFVRASLSRALARTRPAQP